MSAHRLDQAKRQCGAGIPDCAGRPLPEPFKSEPAGGSGRRLHHKFVVIDFDKPTGRVFSDRTISRYSGHVERRNLLLIRDRRVAVVLHDRSFADLRSLSLPCPQHDAGSARKKLSCGDRRGPRRKAVVGRRLHGSDEDSRPRIVCLRFTALDDGFENFRRWSAGPRRSECPDRSRGIRRQAFQNRHRFAARLLPAAVRLLVPAVRAANWQHEAN